MGGLFKFSVTSSPVLNCRQSTFDSSGRMELDWTSTGLSFDNIAMSREPNGLLPRGLNMEMLSHLKLCRVEQFLSDYCHF